jgi:hypothetical protein
MRAAFPTSHQAGQVERTAIRLMAQLVYRSGLSRRSLGLRENPTASGSGVTPLLEGEDRAGDLLEFEDGLAELGRIAPIRTQPLAAGWTKYYSCRRGQPQRWAPHGIPSPAVAADPSLAAPRWLAALEQALDDDDTAAAAASVLHTGDGAVTSTDCTPSFHRWSERNRLLVLLRCAPAWVAARELASFAALTLLLSFRRNRPAHNTHRAPPDRPPRHRHPRGSVVHLGRPPLSATVGWCSAANRTLHDIVRPG